MLALVQAESQGVRARSGTALQAEARNTAGFLWSGIIRRACEPGMAGLNRQYGMYSAWVKCVGVAIVALPLGLPGQLKTCARSPQNKENADQFRASRGIWMWRVDFGQGGQ